MQKASHKNEGLFYYHFLPCEPGSRALARAQG